MVENDQDKLTRAYVRLQSLRKNIDQIPSSIEEKYAKQGKTDQYDNAYNGNKAAPDSVHDEDLFRFFLIRLFIFCISRMRQIIQSVE